MPRFFFDVQNRKGLHRDQYGDECASFEEARKQCQALLPDIASEEVPDGERYTITCEVRDETDRVVYRGRLTFEGTKEPV